MRDKSGNKVYFDPQLKLQFNVLILMFKHLS